MHVKEKRCSCAAHRRWRGGHWTGCTARIHAHQLLLSWTLLTHVAHPIMIRDLKRDVRTSITSRDLKRDVKTSTRFEILNEMLGPPSWFEILKEMLGPPSRFEILNEMLWRPSWFEILNEMLRPEAPASSSSVKFSQIYYFLCSFGPLYFTLFLITCIFLKPGKSPVQPRQDLLDFKKMFFLKFFKRLLYLFSYLFSYLLHNDNFFSFSFSFLLFSCLLFFLCHHSYY
jgi:hypothetical protein